MARLVYTRVSTDEQSTQRQTHVLAEAGLIEGADGVRFFSDPATCSKIPALERDGFKELAAFARLDDTLIVSELYRLCRDLADILAVRTWCQAHDVKLRVLSGALSGIVDLAATDATTTMLVNVLVSVGQFQRDLQNELTRGGLAAAWAQGARSGRRPRLAQLGVEAKVRQAFRDGASIAALARQHQVSRVAIRTAVADLIPGRPEQPTPAADEPQPVRIEIPGKIARHLNERDDLDDAERHALRQGREVRRDQGYSLHVTAPPDIHHALLTAAAELGADSASPAERKAYRIYADRLNNEGLAHDLTPMFLKPLFTAGASSSRNPVVSAVEVTPWSSKATSPACTANRSRTRAAPELVVLCLRTARTNAPGSTSTNGAFGYSGGTSTNTLSPRSSW
ncbi:recombinase family protein [Amycolatopsis sp. 195334CR]|uniref:recombinase family protein n=1 Tax=Amycolatopsis sp. 195334CR TaxID=2814588 RepID=UPI001A8F0B3B|nr:recombinase family protein [Amycolatopsis sp. 195334CR]MBN6039995.1 recombinase family protein [Amycolatopsis sp. 195334CR]